MGIGVFTGMTGTNDGSVALRRLLHLYIVDQLLGECQWIQQEDACDFQEPEVLRRRRSVQPPQEGSHTGRSLDDYVGVYGHSAYGYINVYKYGHGNTARLMLGYGSIGKFRLLATSNADEFEGEGQGHTWVITLNTVSFSSSQGGGAIDRVQVSFDGRDPPVFVRDMALTGIPSCCTQSNPGCCNRE